MRIVDAKVIVCCPGRNFVTVKLVTEDGVSVLGDATLNGRELAVESYPTEHVAATSWITPLSPCTACQSRPGMPRPSRQAGRGSASVRPSADCR